MGKGLQDANTVTSTSALLCALQKLHPDFDFQVLIKWYSWFKDRFLVTFFYSFNLFFSVNLFVSFRFA